MRNFELGSPRPRHAHIHGNLQCANNNYPQSIFLRKLKSLSLSWTKIWHTFILRTNSPSGLHTGQLISIHTDSTWRDKLSKLNNETLPKLQRHCYNQ